MPSRRVIEVESQKFSFVRKISQVYMPPYSLIFPRVGVPVKDRNGRALKIKGKYGAKVETISEEIES
jgi:hypothetical protein